MQRHHYNRIVIPACDLMGAKYNTPEAHVMLLAIGLQESRFKHRKQISGPARGFWQFEERGGCAGVLEHPASQPLMMAAAKRYAYGDVIAVHELYEAVAHHDLLAATAARALLWTDPDPLPALGHVDAAWKYYLRVWRPGKPHRQTWDDLYLEALELVQ